MISNQEKIDQFVREIEANGKRIKDLDALIAQEHLALSAKLSAGTVVPTEGPLYESLKKSLAELEQIRNAGAAARSQMQAKFDEVHAELQKARQALSS